MLGNKKDEIKTPEWIDKINPGFRDSKDPAYRMNCGNCALAYELQSRGVNASAKGNAFGLTKQQLLQTFKQTKEKTILDLDNIAELKDPLPFSENGIEKRGKAIEKALKKNIANAYKDSENARGTLFVPGVLGSHYVSWEKKGTTVAFFNSQDKERDLISSCFAYAMNTGDSSTSLSAIRFDDLEFVEDRLNDLVDR